MSSKLFPRDNQQLCSTMILYSNMTGKYGWAILIDTTILTTNQIKYKLHLQHLGGHSIWHKRINFDLNWSFFLTWNNNFPVRHPFLLVATTTAVPQRTQEKYPMLLFWHVLYSCWIKHCFILVQKIIGSTETVFENGNEWNHCFY